MTGTDCAAQAGEGREVSRRFLAGMTLIGLVSGLCYVFLHYVPTMNGSVEWHLPGLGLTLTWLAWMGGFLLLTRKGGQRSLRGDGLFAAICALLLALTYALFTCDSLRLMNLPVIWACTVGASASTSGALNESPLTAGGLSAVARRLVPGLFRHFTEPPRAVVRGSNRQRLGMVGIGLLAAVPVVALAAALLMSADRAFASALMTKELNTALLGQLLLALALGLAMYSTARCALDPFVAKKADAAKRPQTLYLPVLIALAALYAAFLIIRIRTLVSVSGHEPEQGWASYAREGFFQMTAAALLSLIATMSALRRAPGVAVRGVSVGLLLLTAGVAVLAAMGIFAYISVFGLSLLRLVTLWGMAMVLLAIGAGLWKCTRPAARVCRTLAIAALTSWLALNLCAPGRMIARVNVALYNGGAVSQMDAAYLATLSAAAPLELRNIISAEAREEAIRAAERALAADRVQPYDWAAEWLLFRK